MLKRKLRKKLDAAPPWLVDLVRWERKIRWRVGFWLRERTRKLSPARLRWYCFLFVLVCGMTYTWILVKALSGSGRAPDFRFVVTRPVLRRPSRNVDSISSFVVQMDSIERDALLKRSFDSLMIANPEFRKMITDLERLTGGHR